MVPSSSNIFSFPFHPSLYQPSYRLSFGRKKKFPILPMSLKHYRSPSLPLRLQQQQQRFQRTRIARVKVSCHRDKNRQNNMVERMRQKWEWPIEHSTQNTNSRRRFSFYTYTKALLSTLKTAQKFLVLAYPTQTGRHQVNDFRLEFHLKVILFDFGVLPSAQKPFDLTIKTWESTTTTTTWRSAPILMIAWSW